MPEAATLSSGAVATNIRISEMVFSLVEEGVLIVIVITYTQDPL